jgi:hypothetical protein
MIYLRTGLLHGNGERIDSLLLIDQVLLLGLLIVLNSLLQILEYGCDCTVSF